MVRKPLLETESVRMMQRVKNCMNKKMRYRHDRKHVLIGSFYLICFTSTSGRIDLREARGFDKD